MKERIIAYGVTGLVCFTILIGILFAALWQYKEIIGWTLFGLFVAFAIVFLAWLINELFLRHIRYKYKEEVPMNSLGVQYPKPSQRSSPYTYPVTQPNPYYTPSTSRQEQETYY